MKKMLFATVLVAMMAAPAMANQCPTLMIKIDEAMKTASLDEATKAKVMELYDKGKAEHAAGQHDESVTDLTAALKLLGM